MPDLPAPPMLTADIPGCRGRIRTRPEDFEVEEIPSYEPSGEGDHLYLWVEKYDVGPEYFTRIIAQRLGIHVGAIGTAGLKDRHALTRQWVSVPKEVEPRLRKIDGEGIRVLRVSRHNNKLKPGHLRGNKFTILIREPDMDRRDNVSRILERIRAQGLPNFYGPQRFGRDGSTLELGFQCLAGTQPKRLRPFLYKFALSALQSFLFNDCLARRMNDNFFRKVLEGDVMMKWPFGGLFQAEDVEAEQARFDTRETVTGGPMFGTRTFPAKGIAAEREAAVLRDHKLSVQSFAGFGKLMGGTRRHNLIYLDDLTETWTEAGLRLTFTLPSGSYATVLLEEVMKAPAYWEEEPGEEE